MLDFYRETLVRLDKERVEDPERYPPLPLETQEAIIALLEELEDEYQVQPTPEGVHLSKIQLGGDSEFLGIVGLEVELSELQDPAFPYAGVISLPGEPGGPSLIYFEKPWTAVRWFTREVELLKDSK